MDAKLVKPPRWLLEARSRRIASDDGPFLSICTILAGNAPMQICTTKWHLGARVMLSQYSVRKEHRTKQPTRMRA